MPLLGTARERKLQGPVNLGLRAVTLTGVPVPPLCAMLAWHVFLSLPQRQSPPPD